MLRLPVRTRNRKGTGHRDSISIDPGRTVVFIMDVWDRHWCADVNNRQEQFIPAMNEAVSRLRAAGVHILHMPSDCMDHYRDFAQRKRIVDQPAKRVSRLIYYGRGHNWLRHGRFPIRLAAEGGCPCEPHCEKPMVWKRQHEGITIADEDVIAVDPKEVYTYLKHQHIETILYMGFHANICLLRRPTGIRKMRSLGFQCLLFRDLTDVMYDPKNWPYVSHAAALDKVIRHIERIYCPTVLAEDIPEKPGI